MLLEALCLQRLRTFFQDVSPNQDLITRAYEFRSEPERILLSNVISTNPDIEAWRMIRHYVGRLGSWAKAANFILQVANRAWYLQRSNRVEIVKSMRPLERAVPEVPITYKDVLKHHSLVYDSERLLQSINNNRSELAQILDEEAIAPIFGMQVHAEITMIEHFHANGLVFAGQDRYIGCSKPSCYCCNLYMRHPIFQMEPRSSHLNIWKKWSPPLHPEENDIRTHVVEIINYMTESLQHEVEQNIVRGASHGRRKLDSLTDLSASVPTLRSITTKKLENLRVA